MAAKRPALNLARKPATELAEPAKPAAEGAGEGRGRTVVTTVRRGLTLLLSPEAWRQLKVLAVEDGRPAHDLLIEALNGLFRARGKPPIA